MMVCNKQTGLQLVIDLLGEAQFFGFWTAARQNIQQSKDNVGSGNWHLNFSCFLISSESKDVKYNKHWFVIMKPSQTI